MISKVRKNKSCLVFIYRSYWYKKHYQPPNVEPGVFPLSKKQLPRRSAVPFSERMREMPPPLDNLLTSGINIGMKWEDLPRHRPFFKKRFDLERTARLRTLHLNLEEVNALWFQDQGSVKARFQAALYYGIYSDLFDGMHLEISQENTSRNQSQVNSLAEKYCLERSPMHYFMPVTPMTVVFHDNTDSEGNTSLQVHYGNKLSPTVTSNSPMVTFPIKEGHYYTWLMTCPDGALHQTLSENIHQLVTNVTAGSPGEEIIPYFQPIPFKGTGYHRYIFLLFEHNQPLDLSGYRRGAIKSLEERLFYTYDFYKQFEETITPVGLSFFQATWDSSVRNMFHKVLNCDEPVFDFDWPRPYLPPQQKFAQGESFNKYLDKYRDIHDLEEEVLTERLKRVHPFREPRPPLPYPNAILLPKSMPMWLQLKIQEQRVKKGIWKKLEPE